MPVFERLIFMKFISANSCPSLIIDEPNKFNYLINSKLYKPLFKPVPDLFGQS